MLTSLRIIRLCREQIGFSENFLATSEFQKPLLSESGQVEKVKNLSCENEFHLREIKKSFSCLNGFALSLALKQRLGTSQKSHIWK